jgi:hypothetical protein
MPVDEKRRAIDALGPSGGQVITPREPAQAAQPQRQDQGVSPAQQRMLGSVFKDMQVGGVLTKYPKIGMQVAGKVLKTPAYLFAEVAKGSRGARPFAEAFQNMLASGETSKIYKDIMSSELNVEAFKRISRDIQESHATRSKKAQMMSMLADPYNVKSRLINQKLGELRVSAAERVEEAAPTTQEVVAARETRQQVADLQLERMQNIMEAYDPALDRRERIVRLRYNQALVKRMRAAEAGGVSSLRILEGGDGKYYTIGVKDGEMLPAQEIEGIPARSGGLL